MGLRVCWCESQKKEDQGRAESEVSGGQPRALGDKKEMSS